MSLKKRWLSQIKTPRSEMPQVFKRWLRESVVINVWSEHSKVARD